VSTYGCHNQPRSLHMHVEVQDGWTTDGRRKMKTIEDFAYAQPCRYDCRAKDVRCDGCEHSKVE